MYVYPDSVRQLVVITKLIVPFSPSCCFLLVILVSIFCSSHLMLSPVGVCFTGGLFALCFTLRTSSLSRVCCRHHPSKPKKFKKSDRPLSFSRCNFLPSVVTVALRGQNVNGFHILRSGILRLSSSSRVRCYRTLLTYSMEQSPS